MKFYVSSVSGKYEEMGGLKEMWFSTFESLRTWQNSFKGKDGEFFCQKIVLSFDREGVGCIEIYDDYL
jgi:hypothetical protein